MISSADDSVSTVPAAGSGRLEVQSVYGESTAVNAWATNPLKLLTPRARGQSVWAYLSSFGGGLVAGDQNDLSVSLGVNARCFLSTQASTKVYRNPDSRPSGHRLHAVLAEGSLLVLAPDPVQAFAGSTYIQQQEFHLQTGASLALVDWCCSGRVARGERWAFGSFQSCNQVFLGKERILIDSLALDPVDGPLLDSSRMGRFNSIAMLVFIGPLLSVLAQSLLAEVAARPVERQAQVVCSASQLRDGVILRVAGEAIEGVGRELHRHLTALTGLLGDDPWSRKW